MNLRNITYAVLLLMLGCLGVTQTVAAQGIQGLPDFTPLVKSNRAAVVNIGTTSKRESAGLEGPQGAPIPGVPDDNALQDFFRKFFGDEGRGGRQAPETLSSLGSGFIISEDGYVISNYHVVREADEVIVRMSDRKEYVAEIIGTDPRSDIAVLKIEADGPLPSLKLGKSKELEVGEWVLAIGSPFGFDHSVTAGIVSAKGRSLPNENYVPFIQTDVAINPGNSGGPLFNLEGEVVGVNSQIYSRTGGFMGLSFAIPIDVVMNVYKQLRDKGSVSRGWLGVLIQDVDRALAESFKMEKPHGALVSKVLEDSPAAKSGIEVGD
ncbi:MAG: trypsin-like peptidase domain-containing protein, partial [Gammaproteobacteria bacterium]